MNRRRGVVLVAFIGAAIGSGGCAPVSSTPKLRSSYVHFVADLGGPYRGVGYDAERGVAVVATRDALHLVAPDASGERVFVVTPVELEGFGGEGRIVPARAGGVVVTYRPHEDRFDRLAVHGLDGRIRGTITPADGVPFTTVLLGGPGRTIATVSERRAAGSTGTLVWRWDTWRPDGTAIASWTTPVGVKASFDRGGERILILYGDRAEVLDPRGRIVGAPVTGRFHKAAISDLGRVLVLGAEDDRKAILVVSDGTVRRGVAHAPVHGLGVAPDGRSAWAWFRDAEIRPLSLTDATFGDPVALPADWGARSVTAFVPENGAAALLAVSTTSAATGARGARIVRVSAREVLWETDLPTAQPTAFLPAVLPAAGSVLAWNREILALLPAAGGSGKEGRR